MQITCFKSWTKETWKIGENGIKMGEGERERMKNYKSHLFKLIELVLLTIINSEN